MEQMLKAKDLAEALNVNVETVRRWTRDGIIPHIKLGASKRYSLERVKTSLEAPKTEGKNQ